MSNAARRVHDILARALETSPKSDRPGFEVWPEVGRFKDHSEVQTKRDSLVLHYVATLRDQIDLAEQEAEKSPLILQRLSKPIARARDFTSPQTLPQAWRSSLQHLSADTMVAWDMGALALPKTELESDDPLADVRQAIADLELAAADARITAEFCQLILAQVQALRTAVQMYEIVGAQAIQSQIERTAGAIFAHKDVIARSDEADHAATETTYKKVTGAITSIAKWCRDAKSIHDAAAIGQQAAMQALPHLQALLSNLS
jgi:hypothetical protein